MDSIPVAALFSGISTMLFCLYLMNLRKNRVEERVQKLAGDPRKAVKEEAGGTGGTPRERKQKEWRAIIRDSWLRRLEQEMMQADIPLKPEEYLGFQLIASLGPGILIYLFSSRLLLSLEWVTLSLMLPLLLLRRAKAKRVAAFDRQLGDSLGTIANSLRAGFGFQQAMEMISHEAAPPIGTEMARTIREINLGIPVEEALRNLGRRVASRDLELMVTAVVIQRQVGGNLAEIMDRIAHTIKERARIRGEIKTLTAQGRISGLVIGSLPFALAGFLLTVNPTYLGILFRHPLGLFMVVAGLFAEVMGAVIIRKIVTLDV